ncbi:hypothetical protein [Enterovibrio nigricans]|uniref:Uncharacterized protein n=1 Tax=Enterovibrio nigricans DSM 22720 TaxID=1121868 RepID=A0A1T4UTL1_9GAMM|nr:hypothetical protein [Enterovibrio nigricans]SKA56032.1 hypothetical protein SAMN02745132_02493 [Enterovibrio nigricans DSM 22720]
MTVSPTDNQNYAELNKPLALIILVLGLSFCILNIKLILSDEAHGVLMTLMYAVMAAVALFISVFWVFDSYRTKVTDSYIAKGEALIHWQDVVETKPSEFSVVIKSATDSVVVNYYAYSNPEMLIAKVQELAQQSQVSD